MGVIHKLKPEIIKYITNIQVEKPQFGCRMISGLILDKYQIKVSKSSINSVIKNAGLSKPVGRRPKIKRKIITQAQEQVPGHQDTETSEQVKVSEFESNGAFLLKAIDCLLGQSYVQAVKSTTDNPYLIDLKDVRNMGPGPDLGSIFKEIRCIKVGLSSGKNFYIDGQFRTIWSTPYIPFIFSATIDESNSYIKKYFKENNPLILFTAPGTSSPSEEFLNFLLAMNNDLEGISKLTLYGNKLDEIEVITIAQNQPKSAVFTLWPWQFSSFRTIRSIGEFKQSYQENLKKEVFLANIEVELLQPTVNKRVILRGCALKINLSAKISLVILNNLKAEEKAPEELFNLYISRWPNLEEGFQDFSRKIEYFTYSAVDCSGFSLQDLELEQEPGLYLRALDQYLRINFFPPGYEKQNFSSMSDQIYNLKTKIKTEKGYINLFFQLSPEYPLFKDLAYVCRRVNERNIIIENRRLVLEIYPAT